MRIAILFTLFLAGLYYFYPQGEMTSDSVKVNLSSFRRKMAETPPAKTTLTKRQPAVKIKESKVAEAEEVEHIAEAETSDQEMKDWHSELREMLLQLEPYDGEEIYQNYLAEQTAYRKEFSDLARERANLYAHDDEELSKRLYRENSEAIAEYDYLLGELELKHEQKLKDLLGVYFDQIREMQEQYSENFAEDVSHFEPLTHTR